MVELNSTIFPFLGPIGTFVNTVKVLVGGVFGVYLIILYLRFREYVVMRKMLKEIRMDLREIAQAQGIEISPIKETKIQTFTEYVKDMMRHKPCDPEPQEKQNTHKTKKKKNG